MRKIISILFILFCSFLYANDSIKDYKIGVLSFIDKEKTLQQYQATADFLTLSIPNTRFSIVPMFHDELDEAIVNRRVDFVFTNSGDYVIHQKKGELFRITTVVKNEQDNYLSSFGGVIVALSTRADINTIKDLKNKKIGAAGKYSLGAYQAQAKEMLDNKVSFRESQFIFAGQPQERILSLLFEEKVDVAFLRTGLLESLEKDNKLDITKIKVINQKSDYSYPFVLSTKLYPEWPFASLKHIDNLLIKQIATALMSIKHTDKAAVEGEYYGWSTPQDYDVVRDMLYALNLPPYDKKLDFTPSDIVEKYSDYVSFVFIVIILVTIYLIFITFRLSKTKKALEINQQRLQLAASVYINSQNGVMITDKDGVVEEVNNAFCEITGYTKEDIIGKNASLLKSGKHDKEFYRQMWSDIKNLGYHKCEIFNSKKTGEVFPCILGISTLRDDKGKIKHLIGIFTDITQQKRYENELKFLVYHDSLTKLPNREFLMQRLEQVVAQSARKNLKFALLTLDLDHFKDINDSYGHIVGDEVLLDVSKKLRNRLRQEDSVFRLGGDEFAILLEHVEHYEDVSVVARDIMRLVNTSYKTKGGIELRINASIGIAVYPNHGTSAKQVFQNSDASLYLAKEKGRGIFAYYSDELTMAALKRVEIETKLRNALLKNELKLFYQPQYCIRTNEIIGAEALIRWIKPDGSIIPPSDFIPVAEQTGLISVIGEWVINEACKQVKMWLDSGLIGDNFTMAINISAKQFHNQDINKLIKTILGFHSVESKYLEVEITESTLVDKEEETIVILENLRAQGIRVALDDFGTGYSSLSYLKKFPIDMLKIDKSFVDDIPFGKSDMEIAITIINLGHTFGFRVLAEGVEKEEQLEFLKNQGCDAFQGYLRSKPIPANEFELLLTNN
ncbi:MAG: EAL domain-containing protein [Arcobacteraceae bacterium]|jgi:diguanylate cyclase (GGDEF)-like protein/PAS domain S-box-containing protein|nr:EAL domain-containing protein [Arcobacteraceae bacterium]